MKTLNRYSLIAPCGLNCSICIAYLRKKNKCPGCRGDDAGKPVTRVLCKIKTCVNSQKSNPRFCFRCKEFPCKIIENLDKRYRTRYNMSVIENLNFIKESGIKKFLANEKAKWTCSCGGTICVHKRWCFSCGKLLNNVNRRS